MEDLLAVCSNARVTPVEEPFRSRSAWRVRDARDLAAQLSHEFSVRAALERDSRAPRTLWNTLYLRARRDPDSAPILRAALAALDYRNRAALDAEQAVKAQGEPFAASVSQLETFAACPFKHFAECRLRLRPRLEAELRPTDVGLAHHDVLEHFVRGLVKDGASLAGLRDEDLIQRLDACLAGMERRRPEMQDATRARDVWLLARARRQLERVLRAQRAAAKLGVYRPAAAELAFGMAREGALPALELNTPGGRRILLRGIIDRVDFAEHEGTTLGLVIDYKHTRDKRLNLAHVYHGLSLQLLAYLLVLEEHGHLIGIQGPRDPGAEGEERGRVVERGSERRGQWAASVVPAAALYVSLVDTYERVDHPSAASEEEGDETRGAFPPRGLIDRGHVAALDRGFEQAGRSSVYQIRLTKGGQLGWLDQSDGAESGDFARVLAIVRQRIGMMADAILDGKVDVRPYRLGTVSPCGWCDYRAVCRLEFPTVSVRSLAPLKRSEVFEKLRRE
jgi:ATP-dependent helicase/nuclease subunit B